MAGFHFGLRREPRLEQHEAQKEGFGVRGSGRFMLGGPASGQSPSTRASWLARAGPQLQKHLEVPPCLRRAAVAEQVGWPEAGEWFQKAPLPHTHHPPQTFQGFRSYCAQRWRLTIFSRRKCKCEETLLIFPAWLLALFQLCC